MKSLMKRKILFVLVLGFFFVVSIFLHVDSQRTNNTEYNLQADSKKTLSNQAVDFFKISKVTSYVMSPDGTKIAYVLSPKLQLWNNSLWVADRVPDSAELVNHTLISSEVESVRDWQGDWILYKIRHEEGIPTSYYGRNEFWRIKYDGTNKTQVTFTDSNGIRTDWWNHAYDNMGTANAGMFIPGTDLIYFNAHDGNGWYQSYVCNANGTDNWYSISVPDHTWRISVSPTGNRLLWGAQINFGQPTTQKSCDVNGTNKITIKAFNSVIGVAVLGDGNTVIWSENNSIYAIDMNGTNQRTVIDDGYVNSFAYYDPTDPTGMFIITNRYRCDHICKVNVNGTIIGYLTDGPYNDRAPRITPDGKFLAYLRLDKDYSGSQPYPYELVIKSYEYITPTECKYIPGFPILIGIVALTTVILMKHRYKF